VLDVTLAVSKTSELSTIIKHLTHIGNNTGRKRLTTGIFQHSGAMLVQSKAGLLRILVLEIELFFDIVVEAKNDAASALTALAILPGNQERSVNAAAATTVLLATRHDTWMSQHMNVKIQ
jgi:hypothetical protein